MFKRINTNPFQDYEGIYKVPVQIKPQTVTTAIKGLSLNIFKDCVKKKTTKVALTTKISNVIALYDYNKPEARLSKVLTLLGLDEADVAKLCELDLLGKEITEYWEITCKVEDIKKMGLSPHFASCYTPGSYYITNILANAQNGLCLVRQMNPKGQLLRRFVISGALEAYSGQRERFLNSSGLGIGTANSKNITMAKSFEIATAFLNDKAVKLTPEELKEFSWAKKPA